MQNVSKVSILFGINSFLLCLEAYHDHRYGCGIPEGTDEIAVGNSLPLEFNLDMMNGGTNVQCTVYTVGLELFASF